MYLFHAQSTLSRRSNVQQPVVGVWSCENKVRKRVEVKSKILQSSRKKALKTSLVSLMKKPKGSMPHGMISFSNSSGRSTSDYCFGARHQQKLNFVLDCECCCCEHPMKLQ